jgi:hypothetical protein
VLIRETPARRSVMMLISPVARALFLCPIPYPRTHFEMKGATYAFSLLPLLPPVKFIHP